MIKVTDKYAISSDSDQWVIRQYGGIRKRDGEEVWNAIKHYSTLDRAVKSLGDLMVRESDYHSVTELKTNISHTVDLLNKVFDGLSVTTIEIDVHVR